MRYTLQTTEQNSAVKWMIKSEKSDEPLLLADTKEELIGKLPEFMKGKQGEVWEWNNRWVQHWPK